jgi:hypothetical protein
MATEVDEMEMSPVLCQQEVIQHYLAIFQVGSCHY